MEITQEHYKIISQKVVFKLLFDLWKSSLNNLCELYGSWYISQFPDFFQAVKDYRSALDKDEDFSRAKEGLSKAQKLEKQASKRDYYKILGVKRTATKKEINKVPCII